MIPHLTKAQLTAIAAGCMSSAYNKRIDAVNEAAKPRTTVNGESMTVEKAQAVYESTKDTHDWFTADDDACCFVDCPMFTGSMGYGYQLKKTQAARIAELTEQLADANRAARYETDVASQAIADLEPYMKDATRLDWFIKNDYIFSYGDVGDKYWYTERRTLPEAKTPRESIDAAISLQKEKQND